MDYLKVVLDSYFGNQVQYRDRYFIRQQKDAAERGYLFDEFFKGCEGVSEYLNAEINRIFETKKADARRQIAWAIEFGDKAIENQWNHILDGFNLHEVRLDLGDISSGKYSGVIDKPGLDAIDTAVKKAKETLLKSASPPAKINLPKQIPSKLSPEKIESMYLDLINLTAIPQETDKESFIWAFGGTKVIKHYISLQWNGSKIMLAYFVDVFNLRVFGKSGENDNRRKIEVFEKVFNITGLRGTISEYKNKTGINPNISEGIDDIFNKLQI